MYCLNCGKQMPDNSKFCESCGKPIELGGSSPQQNSGQAVANQSAFKNAAPGQMPSQAPYGNGDFNAPSPGSTAYNSNNFGDNKQNPQPVGKKSGKKSKIVVAIVVPVAVLLVVLAVVIGVLFSGESRIEKAFEDGDVAKIGKLLETYYPNGANDDTSCKYFYAYYLEIGEIDKAADVYLSYLEQANISPENEYYLAELEKIAMQMSYENYIRYTTEAVIYSYTESDSSQFVTEEETSSEAATEVDEETTAEQTTAEQTTAEQTTAEQTTAEQTTAEQTTAEQTTAEQTTAALTTAAPTTAASSASDESEETTGNQRKRPYLDTAPEDMFDRESAGIYVVRVDSLDVRAGCGTEYEIIDRLPNGTDIAVLGMYNGWAYVTCSFDIGGYVFGCEPVDVYGWVSADSIEFFM